MNDIDLAGQVAVVTGAGGGLGRAHALALAARGAAVVVNDIAGADAVAREIVAAGGKAAACAGSVADRSAARAAVECALDSFEAIDIVVNNAGIGGGRPFHEESLDVFEEMVAVHLLGSAAVTHAAWPRLRAKGYGRVVMTTSSAGLWGIEGLAGYSAAKAGIVGLARALAHEGRDAGIGVNVVAPGAKTAMSARLFEGKGGWTWRPELVAPLVVYLASRACTHNGAIFTAMAGHFARVETVRGPGTAFDPRREIAPEEIAAAMGAIERLEGAAPLGHGLGEDIRTIASKS
jgi:NAD(P)-dependent dehydrogenase (short-subunit alcohol dehydrogenase family)